MSTKSQKTYLANPNATKGSHRISAPAYAALLLGLATQPSIALAACNDSLYCTQFGTDVLVRNTTGIGNTGMGYQALYKNKSGSLNTGVGEEALYSNSTGSGNTAFGGVALAYNTIGNLNTAIGAAALFSNSSGSNNIALGSDTLYSNRTGKNNTATGQEALRSNTTGINNIAFGYQAGKLLTTGSYNIDIGHVGVAGETKTIRLGTQGTQLKTFIAGIRGVNVTGGAAVLVSSTGQLGVQSSSRKYKKNIQPMGDASTALMKLKPVTFRYKDEPEGDQHPAQYGLIAEDVDAVMPELVVRDEDGRPATVAYHLLPSLLLNEYQKQQVMLVEVTARAEQDRAKLADVEARASREVAALRDALAMRDTALAAMQAEMKALRQVTQQLMAALPSGNSVVMQER